MQFPATVGIDTPERIANWRPLVQWMLAIPHLVIAYALGYASGAVSLVSWGVILVTGKLPGGLANFQVLMLRFSARATTYAGFLYEAYPPFDLTTSAADPGGSPVRVDIQPAQVGRNRLTVAFRLVWAIPALVFAVGVFVIAAVCWLLGAVAVLFTGRWPLITHSRSPSGQRVNLRFTAYFYLLTDEYPPFSFD